MVVLVLFICTTTYLRSMKATLFTRDSPNSFLRGCWKASRIGERLSPYVSAACVIMALHVVFF